MAPAAGGNFLTEKFGPLPGWGWAALAGGGFLLWRWRQRQAASSSSGGGLLAGGPGQSTAYSEPSASLTTPGGFTYSGPLSGLQYAVPQGAMSATAAPSIPQVGGFTGLGYAPSAGSTSEVGSSGSTYQELASAGQIGPLLQGGSTLYYQPTPGTFVPASSGGQLTLPPGTNTPLYLPLGG